MTKKRATLHRETLRNLSSKDLSRAGGGTEMLTADTCAMCPSDATCETCFCNNETIEGKESGRVCTGGGGR
jgi:hypothetical protein